MMFLGLNLVDDNRIVTFDITFLISQNPGLTQQDIWSKRHSCETVSNIYISVSSIKTDRQ
jgi:hypothetical protein